MKHIHALQVNMLNQMLKFFGPNSNQHQRGVENYKVLKQSEKSRTTCRMKGSFANSTFAMFCISDVFIK